MKILFDHSSPFLLAHGGVQVQIHQTKVALERAGGTVDYVRWWDEHQEGDIIHYFGPVSTGYLRLARQKGIPIVLTSFFSSTCNRSDLRLYIQGIITRSILAFPGGNSIKAQLQWQSFQEASHIIVGLEAEQRVLETVYGLPVSKISIVPLGIDEACVQVSPVREQKKHLISVGTISQVKQSVELAQLARAAQVPILFIGDPYSGEDPYWRQFQGLIDDRFVLHKSHVNDRAVMRDHLTTARGFVLYSFYENWSLAAHEAAACGLPLLLPDLKWARECFGTQGSCFKTRNAATNLKILKEFYASAPELRAPSIKYFSWSDVASRLVEIYKTVAAQPN